MTLVEIAIVLAVLGILLGLGFASLQGWRARTDLRNAVDGVAGALLAARTRAVVERRSYTVDVDYASDSWSATPAIVEGTRSWGSVDLLADSSDPDCPPFSAGDVVFRPNGTADAAGFEAVYLRSKNPKVPARYRVKVLGASGKVSVEKLAGGTWVGAF